MITIEYTVECFILLLKHHLEEAYRSARDEGKPYAHGLRLTHEEEIEIKDVMTQVLTQKAYMELQYAIEDGDGHVLTKLNILAGKVNGNYKIAFTSHFFKNFLQPIEYAISFGEKIAGKSFSITELEQFVDATVNQFNWSEEVPVQKVGLPDSWAFVFHQRVKTAQHVEVL